MTRRRTSSEGTWATEDATAWFERALAAARANGRNAIRLKVEDGFTGELLFTGLGRKQKVFREAQRYLDQLGLL